MRCTHHLLTKSTSQKASVAIYPLHFFSDRRLSIFFYPLDPSLVQMKRHFDSCQLILGQPCRYVCGLLPADSESTTCTKLGGRSCTELSGSSTRGKPRVFPERLSSRPGLIIRVLSVPSSLPINILFFTCPL